MPQGHLAIEQPFDLARTLTMGLVLRWRKENGGWFSGVVDDTLAMLRQASANSVEFNASEPRDLEEELLRRYLGMDRNPTLFREALSRCDPRMSDLMVQHEGMHILRPGPWECLITCVCTPGQRPHRLTSDIERLCEHYGPRVSLDGITRYSFPKAERLAQLTITDLSQVALRMPRRAEYVHRLAEAVANGNLQLEALRTLPHAEARELLLQYGGVTPEIADCVLLYSLDKCGYGVQT